MDAALCTQKLRFLLEKYGVDGVNCALGQGPVLIIESSHTIPLPFWRQERRFTELRQMLNSGQGGFPCTMRVCRIVNRGNTLMGQLRRELDLCEWILGSEVTSIYGTRSGGAANFIVTMANGTICALDIACTLPEGAPSIDRHEIITRRGVLCDRVVDTQIPQHSIYAFGQNSEAAYTDFDFELFGMFTDEILAVRSAFYVITNNCKVEYCTLNNHLQALESAASLSLRDNSRKNVTTAKEAVQ